METKKGRFRPTEIQSVTDGNKGTYIFDGIRMVEKLDTR